MKAIAINRGVLAVAAVGSFMFASIPAQAQWDRDRRDVPFGRDYRVGVQRMVERLEHDSNEFREAFERGNWDRDDRGRRYDRDPRYRNDRNRGDYYYYDRNDRRDRGSGRFHEQLKRDIQRFDERVENLRRNLGRTSYWTDTRGDVSELMRMARIIDRDLDDRGRYGVGLIDRWRRVMMDLNALGGLMGAGRV